MRAAATSGTTGTDTVRLSMRLHIKPVHLIAFIKALNSCEDPLARRTTPVFHNASNRERLCAAFRLLQRLLRCGCFIRLQMGGCNSRFLICRPFSGGAALR